MGQWLEQYLPCYIGGYVAKVAAAWIFVVLSLLLLGGCSWGTTSAFNAVPWTSSPPPSDGSPAAALGVLNWTAGLSIIGGMIGWVLTRQIRTAAIPIVGGCCLIILSYAISAYSHLVLVPVGIVLTLVSAIWGYLTIAKAWRAR